MRAILKFLVSFCFVITSTLNVISCGINIDFGWELPTESGNDNGNENNEEEEVLKYISLEEISQHVSSARWQFTIEDVNSVLNSLQIEGVDSMQAVLVEEDSFDAHVTVIIAEGWILLDDTNAFLLTNALKTVSFVYTEEVIEKTQHLTSVESLNGVQSELDTIEIKGVTKLVAKLAEGSEEDVIITIFVDSDHQLKGADSFEINGAIKRSIENSLEGTLEYLKQLMLDSRTIYLMEEGVTGVSAAFGYVREHADPELIRFVDAERPKAQNIINIQSGNSVEVGLDTVTVTVQYKYPVPVSSGLFNWSNLTNEVSVTYSKV